MKGIILAAGKGSRMGKYTRDLPKGMLVFAGMTLIERQISAMKKAGINDITIVTGYKREKINIPNVKYYINHEFDNTNMIESLFSAEKELNGDCIVSYADIIVEPDIIKKIAATEGEIAVTVDREWKSYWEQRFGNSTEDTESLVLNQDGMITELGEENPPINKLDGRYVGLLKFSSEGIETIKKIYHECRDKNWEKPWQRSGKIFKQAYMTDMLQETIDRGIKVRACLINHGWLEFDTEQDYEKMTALHQQGKLSPLFKV